MILQRNSYCYCPEETITSEVVDFDWPWLTDTKLERDQLLLWEDNKRQSFNQATSQSTNKSVKCTLHIDEAQNLFGSTL